MYSLTSVAAYFLMISLLELVLPELQPEKPNNKTMLEIIQ
jgi:hypothetical protein